MLCKRRIKTRGIILQFTACQACRRRRRWVRDDISRIDQPELLTLTRKGQILYKLQRWLTLQHYT